MICSRSRISSIACDELGIGLEAERRDETRRPQHAQRVVAERDLGRERRAQPARREIGEPVVRIEELGLVERDRRSR